MSSCLVDGETLTFRDESQTLQEIPKWLSCTAPSYLTEQALVTAKTESAVCTLELPTEINQAYAKWPGGGKIYQSNVSSIEVSSTVVPQKIEGSEAVKGGDILDPTVVVTQDMNMDPNSGQYADNTNLGGELGQAYCTWDEDQLGEVASRAGEKKDTGATQMFASPSSPQSVGYESSDQTEPGFDTGPGTGEEVQSGTASPYSMGYESYGSPQSPVTDEDDIEMTDDTGQLELGVGIDSIADENIVEMGTEDPEKLAELGIGADCIEGGEGNAEDTEMGVIDDAANLEELGIGVGCIEDADVEMSITADEDNLAELGIGIDGIEDEENLDDTENLAELGIGVDSINEGDVDRELASCEDITQLAEVEVGMEDIKQDKHDDIHTSELAEKEINYKGHYVGETKEEIGSNKSQLWEKSLKTERRESEMEVLTEQTVMPVCDTITQLTDRSNIDYDTEDVNRSYVTSPATTGYESYDSGGYESLDQEELSKLESDEAQRDNQEHVEKVVRRQAIPVHGMDDRNYESSDSSDSDRQQENIVNVKHPIKDGKSTVGGSGKIITHGTDKTPAAGPGLSKKDGPNEKGTKAVVEDVLKATTTHVAEHGNIQGDSEDGTGKDKNVSEDQYQTTEHFDTDSLNRSLDEHEKEHATSDNANKQMHKQRSSSDYDRDSLNQEVGMEMSEQGHARYGLKQDFRSDSLSQADNIVEMPGAEGLDNLGMMKFQRSHSHSERDFETDSLSLPSDVGSQKEQQGNFTYMSGRRWLAEESGECDVNQVITDFDSDSLNQVKIDQDYDKDSLNQFQHLVQEQPGDHAMEAPGNVTADPKEAYDRDSLNEFSGGIIINQEKHLNQTKSDEIGDKVSQKENRDPSDCEKDSLSDYPDVVIEPENIDIQPDNAIEDSNKDSVSAITDDYGNQIVQNTDEAMKIEATDSVNTTNVGQVEGEIVQMVEDIITVGMKQSLEKPRVVTDKSEDTNMKSIEPEEKAVKIDTRLADVQETERVSEDTDMRIETKMEDAETVQKEHPHDLTKQPVSVPQEKGDADKEGPAMIEYNVSETLVFASDTVASGPPTDKQYIEEDSVIDRKGKLGEEGQVGQISSCQDEQVEGSVWDQKRDGEGDSVSDRKLDTEEDSQTKSSHGSQDEQTRGSVKNEKGESEADCQIRQTDSSRDTKVKDSVSDEKFHTEGKNDSGPGGDAEDEHQPLDLAGDTHAQKTLERETSDLKQVSSDLQTKKKRAGDRTEVKEVSALSEKKRVVGPKAALKSRKLPEVKSTKKYADQVRERAEKNRIILAKLGFHDKPPKWRQEKNRISLSKNEKGRVEKTDRPKSMPRQMTYTLPKTKQGKSDAQRLGKCKEPGMVGGRFSPYRPVQNSAEKLSGSGLVKTKLRLSKMRCSFLESKVKQVSADGFETDKGATLRRQSSTGALRPNRRGKLNERSYSLTDKISVPDGKTLLHRCKPNWQISLEDSSDDTLSEDNMKIQWRRKPVRKGRNQKKDAGIQENGTQPKKPKQSSAASFKNRGERKQESQRADGRQRTVWSIAPRDTLSKFRSAGKLRQVSEDPLRVPKSATMSEHAMKSHTSCQSTVRPQGRGVGYATEETLTFSFDRTSPLRAPLKERGKKYQKIHKKSRESTSANMQDSREPTQTVTMSFKTTGGGEPQVFGVTDADAFNSFRKGYRSSPEDSGVDTARENVVSARSRDSGFDSLRPRAVSPLSDGLSEGYMTPPEINTPEWRSAESIPNAEDQHSKLRHNNGKRDRHLSSDSHGRSGVDGHERRPRSPTPSSGRPRFDSHGSGTVHPCINVQPIRTTPLPWSPSSGSDIDYASVDSDLTHNAVMAQIRIDPECPIHGIHGHRHHGHGHAHSHGWDPRYGRSQIPVPDNRPGWDEKFHLPAKKKKGHYLDLKRPKPYSRNMENERNPVLGTSCESIDELPPKGRRHAHEKRGKNPVTGIGYGASKENVAPRREKKDPVTGEGYTDSQQRRLRGPGTAAKGPTNPMTGTGHEVKPEKRLRAPGKVSRKVNNPVTGDGFEVEHKSPRKAASTQNPLTGTGYVDPKRKPGPKHRNTNPLTGKGYEDKVHPKTPRTKLSGNPITGQDVEDFDTVSNARTRRAKSNQDPITGSGYGKKAARKPEQPPKKVNPVTGAGYVAEQTKPIKRYKKWEKSNPVTGSGYAREQGWVNCPKPGSKNSPVTGAGHHRVDDHLIPKPPVRKYVGNPLTGIGYDPVAEDERLARLKRAKETSSAAVPMDWDTSNGTRPTRLSRNGGKARPKQQPETNPVLGEGYEDEPTIVPKEQKVQDPIKGIGYPETEKKSERRHMSGQGSTDPVLGKGYKTRKPSLPQQTRGERDPVLGMGVTSLDEAMPGRHMKEQSHANPVTGSGYVEPPAKTCKRLTKQLSSDGNPVAGYPAVVRKTRTLPTNATPGNPLTGSGYAADKPKAYTPGRRNYNTNPITGSGHETAPLVNCKKRHLSLYTSSPGNPLTDKTNSTELDVPRLRRPANANNNNHNPITMSGYSKGHHADLVSVEGLLGYHRGSSAPVTGRQNPVTGEGCATNYGLPPPRSSSALFQGGCGLANHGMTVQVA